MVPGEYFLKDDDILCNPGREIVHLKVVNSGDRPVQVGSHFHFFEVNKALLFDRSKAFGKRLNIPSGTAVRFEPGEEKDVTLVVLGGNQVVHGLNGLTAGSVRGETAIKKSLKRAAEKGFLGVQSGDAENR
ncbi:MAG: urease subunit beta [Peptococcaceae bacterium]|nr:urease subunit beta [Peptococcaceae bacterium]